MNISIFTIFRIFGAVSRWADKALEDGKITISETVDLAEDVSSILGIPLEIDIAPPKKEPIQTDDLIEAQAKPSPHKTEA